MDNKVCIITGASRGLGEALAKQFKHEGYSVVGLARREDKLRELKSAQILDDYFVCDLAKKESIDSFIRYVESRYQKIDVLMLNAGIQSHYSILNSSSYYSLVDTELKVNFLAPVQITAGLVGLLEKSKAKIVAVTSLLQIAPKKDAPGYCASKAALTSWIRNLRLQMSGAGVAVVEVIPGLIETAMTPQALRVGIDPEILALQIVKNMGEELVVLKGAKLAWAVNKIAPQFVQKKIMHGV
jgi:uncharacterized oxidoreductase